MSLASMRACPESGATTGPLTPQQKIEERVAAPVGAARSLEQQFETLNVCISPPVSSASGGSSSAFAAPDSCYEGDQSEVGCSEEQASWHQADHDHEEPILQNNDERFCLLPVK